MAELKYVMLTNEESGFDCGNSAINDYVEKSYFANISQQCYAYKIMYKTLVVGYYMITLRDVVFSDCPDEITDYHQDSFSEFYPSVYINYLAIGTDFQRKKIGTNTLNKIINETRQLTEKLPVRFITINAVPDKVAWYEKMGFKKMRTDLDQVNTYMYIDCIRDKEKLVEYCEEELSQFM